MDTEDDGTTTISNHEMISTLKSELAALQFKRDRLMSEVGIVSGLEQYDNRETRIAEMNERPNVFNINNSNEK